MDKFKVGDKVWVYDTVKAVASLEPSVLTENGVWVSAWKVRSAKNSMPPVLGAPYRLEDNPAPAAAQPDAPVHQSSDAEKRWFANREEELKQWEREAAHLSAKPPAATLAQLRSALERGLEHAPTILVNKDRVVDALVREVVAFAAQIRIAALNEAADYVLTCRETGKMKDTVQVYDVIASHLRALAAQPATVRPCAECGKPEDNCVHVRYGNDVEAIGVKHYYIPKAAQPAPARPESCCSICGKQGVTEQDSHGPCGLREADNDKV